MTTYKDLKRQFGLDLWESVLYSQDKTKAKELCSFINSFPDECDPEDKWKQICLKLEYPLYNAFTDKVMRSHFRRVLVELKLLSVFGGITWQYFKQNPKVQRIY